MSAFHPNIFVMNRLVRHFRKSGLEVRAQQEMESSKAGYIIAPKGTPLSARPLLDEPTMRILLCDKSCEWELQVGIEPGGWSTISYASTYEAVISLAVTYLGAKDHFRF